MKLGDLGKGSVSHAWEQKALVGAAGPLEAPGTWENTWFPWLCSRHVPSTHPTHSGLMGPPDAGLDCVPTWSRNPGPRLPP